MLTYLTRLIKNRKGFTLIELMIVVVILGILAGTAVATFGDNSSKKAQLSKIKSDLRTIESAVQMYRLDNNNTNPTNIAALVPNYIKSNPKSPMVDTIYELSGARVNLYNDADSDDVLDATEHDAADDIYVFDPTGENFTCSSENI